MLSTKRIQVFLIRHSLKRFKDLMSLRKACIRVRGQRWWWQIELKELQRSGKAEMTEIDSCELPEESEVQEPWGNLSCHHCYRDKYTLWNNMFQCCFHKNLKGGSQTWFLCKNKQKKTKEIVLLQHLWRYGWSVDQWISGSVDQCLSNVHRGKRLRSWMMVELTNNKI